MTTLAIMIKTFLRSDCLFECVDSIRSRLADVPYRIYIADDGKIDDRKRRLYETLKRAHHFVLELPFDVGASAARNALVPHIRESLVLRLDDDFLISDETDVAGMMAILESVDHLGAISDLERERHGEKGVRPGEISVGQGEMEIRDRILIRTLYNIRKLNYETVGSLRFHRADYTRNFLLIKSKMLEEIRWDDRLKMHGEHVDFMLQIQQHPFWNLAFTPDSIHLHIGPPRTLLPEEYLSKRYREDTKLEVFSGKWDIEKLETRDQAARSLAFRASRFLRGQLKRIRRLVGV